MASHPWSWQLWTRWPQWSAVAAGAWSATYAVLGAVWWTGVSWYPFARVPDNRSTASPLEHAPAGIVGPGLVVVGLAGVVASYLMWRVAAGRSRAPVPWPVVVFGAGLAVVGTCVVPDYTVIAFLALWPVIAVFAVTGVPGAQGGIEDILYWHRVNLLLVFAGGLLWALASLAAYRRSRGGCGHCGRRAGGLEPDRERLLSIGRRCVWLGVLSTVPYEVTRVAWFCGWPLGLSDDLFESLHHPSGLLALGVGFALMSTGGAALTHGLVARWGEVFPAWLPLLSGRRVPVLLAVVPAAMVTVTLPSASLMSLNSQVNGDFSMADWGTWLPALLWLGWAAGLGLATYTYYLRRRGPCPHCTFRESRGSRPACHPWDPRNVAAVIE